MEQLVNFNNVSKQYKETTALDDVSFTIKKGRCTGLLGVNGAGKTTTLKILSGLLKPSNGDVTYGAKTINSSDDFLEQYKGKIGYLSQHPKFYDWMTGYEYLKYIADLFKIPNSIKEARIKEALEIVNLIGSEKKRIRGYSGGMKQRLGIAQAIINKPEFLILDEPVSALDPEGRYQIIKLLQEIKQHTTILFSTHILHDADSVCDDIIILHKGKKIIETDLDMFKEKYQEPIIKIALLNSADGLENILTQYNWIEDISINGVNLELRVKDREIALQKLPLVLIENNYAFKSFQLFEPNLEDIFLKLVSKQ